MATGTIFALSTGGGAAGIAVIRISGPEAVSAAARFVGPLPKPGRAVLRDVVDPDSREKIDSGVILFFAGPRSFTGEDLVELQVHGSIAVTRAILAALSRVPGLRLAEAGEFTGRAFLNGKMDLIEVEALGDLLAAETMAQARFAGQFQKRLRRAVAGWRETLLDLLALTEAHIDFSDEGDVAAGAAPPGAEEILTLQVQIGRAIAGFDVAERIRNGVRVAILGEPNAGKSSLLNALAARDAAIVSAVPGTTRDVIEVHLDLGGVPVILVDTAGLRETTDEIERIGVERALEAAKQSDVRLWLSPVTRPALSPISDSVSVGTMVDLVDSQAERPEFDMVCSVRSGHGLDILLEFLKLQALEWSAKAGSVMVASRRQIDALGEALLCLQRAATFGPEELELRGEELRGAARALDRLIGRIDYEEVLGSIFSRFCIGK